VKARALALLLSLSCTTPSPPPPKPDLSVPELTTLFISADLRGYIGPCGCSENMRGGIGRAAFQVAQAQQEGHPVLLLDSGNALFGAPTIAPEAVPQQERKAKALAQAFTTMGLVGRAVGPLDNARGEAFRVSLGLRELEPVQLLTPAIAVVTASELTAVPALTAKARAKGARFVVALVQQSFELTLPGAMQSEVGGPDLLIAALAKDELSTEENKLVGDRVRVVQLQSKGRSLLRVDLTLRGQAAIEWVRSSAEKERELASLAERIELLRVQVNEPMLNQPLKVLRKAKLEEIIGRREALAAQPPPPVPADRSSVSARFIPLEASFEELPAVKEIVTAYDRDVGLINLAWAKEHPVTCETPAQGQAGFVGTATCQACHAGPAAVWKASKHALAYGTLENLGKNNHLDCVGCHVTGWKKPGGVCRIDQPAGRAEVGCESCHGPGSLHLAAPSKTTITRSVSAATCVGCHDRENAPHFAFETSVEKILGPGHGR